MSFKRDGNDSGLLAGLQKRRIQELFAEDIPKEEAKLLANGRFTCLVCSSNPIFDTIPMLSVHRKGKKHQYYDEIHKKKKEEIRQLIAKRRHDKFLESGSTFINVAVPDQNRLTTSCAYDPRTKRKPTKGGRRLHICLDDNNTKTTHSAQHSPLRTNDKGAQSFDTHTSDVSPFNQVSPFQSMCQQQLQGPVTHDAQIKNIFPTKSTQPTRLTPYASKNKRHSHTTELTTSIHDNNRSKKFCYNHTNTVKACWDCHNNDNHTASYSMHNTINDITRSSCNSLNMLPSHSCAVNHVMLNKSKLPPSSHFLMEPPPPDSPSPSSNLPQSSQSSSVKKKSSEKERQHIKTSTVLNDAQKTIAKKYQQLHGSGWKRDWDGKWIKDEQAEFDSDEEPPDLP